MKRAFILLLIACLAYACGKKAEERTDVKMLPNLNGKKVVMIIASQNFRDEELQEPKSLLEGRGAKVVIACSMLSDATGMKGMKVKPDIPTGQVNIGDYDAVIFVGGSGATEYWNDPKAHRIATAAVEANKVLGAICIAPVTLANAGLLNGKRVTAFPSERERLVENGAIYTGTDVEVDGKIITGSGPEVAKKFGEAIARAIGGSS